MAFLRTVFSVNSWLATGIGLPVNVLLLWLILNQTPKEMQAYSRILLQTCICDIALLILQPLAQTVFVIDGKVDTSMLLGPLQALTFPWSTVVYFLWGFLMVTTVNQFWIQFYFRYLQLTKNRKLSLFRYILALFAIPALFIFCCFCFQLVGLFNGTPFTGGFTDPEVAELLGFPTDNNPPVNFAFRLKSVYYNNHVLLCMFCLCCFFVTYNIAIVCAVKTQRYVRLNLISKSQERAREINNQLHRTLCIQALIPLFALSTLFANFIIFSRYFIADSVSAQRTLTIGLISDYWIPALNPFVTIAIIKAYHQSLYQWVSQHSLSSIRSKTSDGGQSAMVKKLTTSTVA